MMCKVLRVSRSGYYKWRSRDYEARDAKENELIRRIEEIHRASRCTYGSPRIHAQLRGMGIPCNKSKVERLMRRYNIRSKIRGRYTRTTDSGHLYKIGKNILKRRFDTTRPNRYWVADVSHLWTREGWLYLAVILDLYSRKVVGWAVSEKNSSDLTASALKMAIERRSPGRGLLHHSDRGSHYASFNYQRLLKRHGFRMSMSRRADCWDNAVVESFFHTLKGELGEIFPTRQNAKDRLFEWIEIFYNNRRLHSKLGYRTPAQYENDPEAN